MRCWLVKSEPSVYSIDDLARDLVTGWDGIRNYQARNSMRDDMRIGDRVLFYHSNAEPPGVAGIAEVASAAYPDETQWQVGHEHYDETSTRDDPRWMMVDLRFAGKFARFVPLDVLKADPALDGMLVTRKGQRLSVMPVDPGHYARVVRLGTAS
jgi:predicted RNA-binding protein with PUA-like domain